MERWERMEQPNVSVSASPPRTIGSGRRRALLTSVVALASLAALVAGPLDALAKPGTATEKVAVRAEPDDDAPVLIVLPTDLGVSIKGKPRDGYYPISYAGIDGWVPTGSLATSVDDDADDDRGGEVIASDDLDLHAEPSADAAVLLVIRRGAAVVPTGQHSDGFVEVTHDGTTGWALGEDLAAARATEARDPRDFGRAEIIRIIYAAADYYQQPREDMLRVARCESDLSPTAVNPRTGDSGLFQFNPQTWLSTPYGEYDIFDPRASAYAAGWMWANGRRDEWVCQ